MISLLFFVFARGQAVKEEEKKVAGMKWEMIVDVMHGIEDKKHEYNTSCLKWYHSTVADSGEGQPVDMWRTVVRSEVKIRCPFKISYTFNGGKKQTSFEVNECKDVQMLDVMLCVMADNEEHPYYVDSVGPSLANYFVEVVGTKKLTEVARMIHLRGGYTGDAVYSEIIQSKIGQEIDWEGEKVVFKIIAHEVDMTIFGGSAETAVRLLVMTNKMKGFLITPEIWQLPEHI